MAEGEGKATPCDTPPVQYLQSGPDTPHTCWFRVHNSDVKAPELIAGCKLHMMTYSEPLRNMLYESEIAEKGTKEDPVEIPDIKPDTFRNFVKFINFNTVPTLALEEVVDLLYVAEKYIVEDLKTKLEQQIVSLLNVDSVFVLMKRPECLHNETIKNAIYKLVEQKTKELFAKEEFLELSSSELLNFVVTQDTLSVTELELWREILRWGKHKAQPEEGEKLRECMSELLKHIRFCTLYTTDFCKEVVSTGILTATEVLSITMVFGGKLDCEKTSSICYEQSARKLSAVTINQSTIIDLITLGLNSELGCYTDSYIFITTDGKPIQLLWGVFKSPPHNYSCPPRNLKLQCNCKVSLTRITDYSDDTSTETPVEFEFVKDVAYNSLCNMYFADTMKLQPYNKYKLELKFSKYFPCVYSRENDKVLNHETLMISWWCGGNAQTSKTHLRRFKYKTL